MSLYTNTHPLRHFHLSLFLLVFFTTDVLLVPYSIYVVTYIIHAQRPILLFKHYNKYMARRFAWRKTVL